ncbi:uncharacterized protein LOC127879939 [Dreissena polymorpha]|uniref:uncharacterized protein LOC127879939 n=1 Tax=Dreissena polymorpha TaxID=45954 RepID=UPI0022645CC8|nr:uncharacterized protein LOC127879939 [Dreissena polymorpha]
MPSSDDSFTESLTDVPELSLDDGVETLIKAQDSSTKDTYENEAQKMFLGIFDVHIENLIPPSPKRASRLLDLEHVKFLMDSFQSGVFQQLTLLVGMVPDDCDPSKLKMKGAGQVETLGGNHTREALQGLLRRGLATITTVKMNIYSALSTCTALTVGWQHNVCLQEKQKPLSFIDKVRLMRQVRPSMHMSPTDMKAWKETLSSIFHVKDIRRFQNSYGLHMKMARLEQRVWAIVEEVSGDSVKITEKFFRPLLKIQSTEDIESCLNILRSKGLAEYNNKIKEFLGSRPLTKKRKQTDLEDDANEECSNTSEGLLEKYSKVVDELQMMKDKCSKLETENSELRRQLTEHCSKSKENSSKDKEIEAFWRFEDGREEWLPAKLIRKYANGECSVQYSDGVSRVRSSWVREVGQM